MKVAKKQPDTYIVRFTLITLVFATSILLIPNLYDPTRNATALSLIYITITGMSLWLFTSKENAFSWNIIDFLFCCGILLNNFYQPSYIYMIGVLQNVTLIILYVFLRVNKKHLRSIMFVHTCGIIGLLLLSIQGYAQYLDFMPSYSPYFRITGIFRNPALFAGLITMMMVLVISLYFSKTTTKQYKIVAAIVLLLSLPILYMSASRTSWIALTIGIGYLFYRHCHIRIKLRFPQNLLYTSIAFFVIGIISWKVYHVRPDSAQGRILIWKIAAKMGLENPVRGSGANSFQSNYLHYQAQYFEQNGSVKEKQLAGNNYLVYNEPLRIWIEQGLLGILLYVGSVIGLIFCIKPKDQLGIVAKAVLLAFIVFGFFSYPMQSISLLIWMTVMVAVLGNNIKPIARCTRSYGQIFRFGILLGIVWIAYLTMKQHHAYSKFQQVLSTGAVTHTSRMNEVRALAELEPVLNGDVGYLAVYARRLYNNGNYKESIRIIQQWERIYPVHELYILWGDCLAALGKPWQEAESKYIYASRIIPSRQKARARLALLYRENENFARGFQLAQEILTEPIKIYGFDTYELHKLLKQEFNIQ